MEQFADVAAVAFGPVVDEHLVGRQVDAPCGVVVLHDGLPQGRIALFRPVAVEGGGRGQFVHGTVHGLHHGRCQGLCHVADVQADDVRVGMPLAVAAHSFRYLGKEVMVRQLQEMGID